MREAMKWLGEQPDVLFLGQGVGVSGTKMSKDFEDVPAEKRIEFPVAENLQTGVAIGLSLEGFTPVSVYPRIDFLMCAMDQLVLHLDKLPLYSGYQPKVIIRTAVGSKTPLDAGPQHTGDYTLALVSMFESVAVVRTEVAKDAWGFTPLQVYQDAYARSHPTIVVED